MQCICIVHVYIQVYVLYIHIFMYKCTHMYMCAFLHQYMLYTCLYTNVPKAMAQQYVKVMLDGTIYIYISYALTSDNGLNYTNIQCRRYQKYIQQVSSVFLSLHEIWEQKSHWIQCSICIFYVANCTLGDRQNVAQSNKSWFWLFWSDCRFGCGAGPLSQGPYFSKMQVSGYFIMV